MGTRGRSQSRPRGSAISDFQLADEESPARVEFLDFGPFSSAWRTNEALIEPHQTRPKLIRALRTLQTKRVEQPKRKHGNIPL